MIEGSLNLSLMILLMGGAVVLAIVFRAGFDRLNLPSLVGYILLGFLIRLADSRWGFMSGGPDRVFNFLAKAGLIALLFRIGLESNIHGLLGQLKRASLIWAGNVLISGGLGYIFARAILGFELIPSLFAAIALTATSVGISVGVWREAGALNSPTGELLLDVAELDDISSIGLMAVLFAVVPVLRGGGGGLAGPLFSAGGAVAGKLVIFGFGCVLF